MSKSYDLSTSTKWANLVDGDHVVKLRARGSGFGSSSFSNSVTVRKGVVAMPVKGDLITIESKQYRVLKINDTVAEVLAMYDASTSQVFDDQKYGNPPENRNFYAGKNLDTYCNDTFYNALSAAMKAAIVDKTFTQDSWKHDISSAPTQEHYTGQATSDVSYYLTLLNTAYGASITRHCYCISVQDVLDYLGTTTSMGISDTTLTGANVLQLFWNAASVQDVKYIWLRSADSYIAYAFFAFGAHYGRLDSSGVDTGRIVRPAFQIDLSKIEWTPVGVTEHTLTFSGVTVTVDGTSVASPYTLTKNCTIVATTNTSNYEVVVTAGSVEHHTDTDGNTLSLTSTDINIVEANVGATKASAITINYTT